MAAQIAAPAAMPRRSGRETRAEILDAAARAFRTHGYDVATLEAIGAEVGVTRAAVLHHFASKADMLTAIVRPYLTAVDALLDRVEQVGPLSTRRQRAFFTDFVELAARYRPVAALLSRDISTHHHLGPDLQVLDRAARMATMVGMANPSAAPAARAMAAIGAVMRPVAAPDELVDLDDPETRRVLVECAVAALRAGGAQPR